MQSIPPKRLPVVRGARQGQPGLRQALRLRDLQGGDRSLSKPDSNAPFHPDKSEFQWFTLKSDKPIHIQTHQYSARTTVPSLFADRAKFSSHGSSSSIQIQQCVTHSW